MEEDPYDFYFKLLVVGDSAVGKTCLLHRLQSDAFTELPPAGPFGEFMGTKTDVDGKMIKLHIKDTFGQETAHLAGVEYFYPRVHGFLVLFDVTKAQSFDNVKKWVDEIKQHAKEKAVVSLVGNKSDLASRRVVSFEQGRALADSLGIVSYTEISVKESINVDSAIMSIVAQIKDSFGDEQSSAAKKNKGEIVTLRKQPKGAKESNDRKNKCY